jgi:hypothetical protein
MTLIPITKAQRIAIRDYVLSRRPGAWLYKITQDNVVHVYGEMPNTAHLVGWYVAGSTSEILQEIANFENPPPPLDHEGQPL